MIKSIMFGSFELTILLAVQHKVQAFHNRLGKHAIVKEKKKTISISVNSLTDTDEFFLNE